MPGPGGSHGGGSRGGFGGGFGGGPHGGGGFRGGPGGFGGRPGGFGGGPRGPHGPRGPRGPRWGGFWGPGWHRHPYGYGGGCLGGILSMMILPIFILIIAAVILFSSFGNAFSSLARGGDVPYDEETIQDYADQQYAAEFGNSAAYEDHILIVFLTDEDHYDYNYIAWVGDHIATDINQLFDSYGEFGRTIHSTVNSDSYKYSLDSDLAKVIEHMELEIAELELSSSFTCKENRAQADSHLTNKTDLQLTASTVDTALDSFTEATGISIVIVVDEMEDVFGRTLSAGSIFTLILAVALVILAIWLIVRAVKKRNSNDGNGNQQSNNSSWNDDNNDRNGW